MPARPENRSRRLGIAEGRSPIIQGAGGWRGQAPRGRRRGFPGRPWRPIRKSRIAQEVGAVFCAAAALHRRRFASAPEATASALEKAQAAQGILGTRISRAAAVVRRHQAMRIGVGASSGRDARDAFAASFLADAENRR